VDKDPQVSVVIASPGGDPRLGDCIASFLEQGRDIEVIVACGPDVNVPLDGARLRVLRANRRRSIPELRADGLAAARAPIVAMTEDHCVAAPGWLTAVLDAHRAPAAAVGGAVENRATTRTVDWAVYLCEYGRYMLPFDGGPSRDLPGSNVSYKRDALADIDALIRGGAWEPFWHDGLAARGCVLTRDPAIVVYHDKRFTFGGFMRERYHYARSFAGQRVAAASAMRRLLFAAGTPLLPALLLVRLAAAILPKRRHRGRLLQAAPLVAAFTLAWAIGEAVGYLAGPGTSATRIA